MFINTSFFSKALINAALVSALITTSFTSIAQVVRFSEVKEQNMQARKRVLGTLKAYNKSDIAAAEAGIVKAVLFNDGDLVNQGDILVQLDDRKLNSEKQRLLSEHAVAKAHFELAKAEFEQAEFDFIAYQQSETKNAISKQRLRQSKTATIASQAKVIAAQQTIQAYSAQISNINFRIQDMAIRAPFSGQITQRRVELGQWLATGDIAITLTSLNKLEAWLDVPERFAHYANTNPSSIALQIGDKLINGQNIKVLNNVDNRARTFQVISLIQEQGLMPGMSVSAWLPEGENKSTLTVPKDALVRRGNNTLVYKITSQGDQQIAQAINVNVKFHQADSIAIFSQQLSVGDKVITEGNERLMPGPVVAVADTQSNQIATKATTSALK